VQDLQHTLTVDESGRAERFCFHKDRRHFIVTRGLLRAILSRYLDVDPGQVRFCYSDHGEPSVAPKSGQTALSFKLAHSDELFPYAITRDRQIGIDLERVRPISEAEHIAERYFSVHGSTVLGTLRAELKQEAFLICWVRPSVPI
jgi:4'-phosphopantetheinyl transferase